MIGLTPKQRQRFNAIAEMNRTGERITYDRLAYKIGLASKSGALRLTAQLMERGWVRDVHGRITAICKAPDGHQLRFIPASHVRDIWEG